MLRTIIWYAHFAGSLVLVLPKAFKLNRLRKKNPEELEAEADKIIGKWAYSQIKYSGTDIIIKGEENIPADGAVLFVANHQSNFDIAIFLGCIHKPKGYIAKIETKKIPIVSTFMEYIQCVFMDRDDLKQSLQAILEGIDILKSGHSLVVFPEGTRSKGGPVGEFKAGSFKLATKPKVPIIPVTFDGSYKIMEANNSKIKPATVYVTIHEKIETVSLTKEETAALPDKVREIIVSAIR